MRKTILKLIKSKIIYDAGDCKLPCDNCDRNKVTLVKTETGNRYHICRFCGWIKETQRTVCDLENKCDSYTKDNRYLFEVSSRVEGD